MSRTGVLIALAYPEEFVSMIPAWYRKPLEWIGLIKDDMICTGHAALALVNNSTGRIEYADFGRYITPFGKGRTRTEFTDPDCKFDIVAQFDDNGKIINEKEILLHIEAHPEKTHGAGRMYASFCYDVDYDKAKAFIRDINLKGSVTYDPFKKEASNCARFVYDTFLAGMNDKKQRSKLIKRNVLTPAPLGIVFYGTDQGQSFSVLDGKLEEYQGKKFRAIIKHLFLKPDNASFPENKKKDLAESHHWLDGVGDSGWFRLSKPNGKYIFERRKADGRVVFEEEFLLNNKSFDISKPFKLVHDCNALWCTVEQNGETFKLYHRSYIEAIQKEA